MPFASRGARSIHYSIAGSGAPLVLVPGLGSGARLFGTLPRRFARAGFRCATFDPVGFAPSSEHAGDYDFEQAARDLLAVLDAAGFARCRLAGTSLGGKVALAATALAPERVDSLVLLASAARVTPRARRVHRFFEIAAEHLPPAEFAETVAPFLFGSTFQRRHAGVVDDIVRALRPDARTRAIMRAQARALQAFDGEPLARAVRCPTLCLAGTEDTLTLAEEVEATAALIPGATYRAIAAGHSLLLESNDAFTAVCQPQ
jgi:3-oxoadipate enol-lactonase/4-carboxymuconolactone decarboxylase